MKKILIFLFVILLILFFSKNHIIGQKFDYEKWKPEWDVHMKFIPTKRYLMMKWLERNYAFCGKTENEILSTFGEDDSFNKENNEIYYILKQDTWNIDVPAEAGLMLNLKDDTVISAVIDYKYKKSKQICSLE